MVSLKLASQKKRQFFSMGYLWSGGPPGVKLLNEAALLGGRPLLKPVGLEVGFPKLSETPLFLFDKKLGRPARDFEKYEGYWFISDKAKSILEAIDPGAFEFLECKIISKDIIDNIAYWLCDVIRIISAVDENKSKVIIEYNSETKSKRYLLNGCRSFIFNEEIIVSSHIFRMKYAEPLIVCDSYSKLFCQISKLKGIKFHNLIYFNR